MPVSVRSFAKINLGLFIGSRRPDGFHDLRTVYQTIALHDRLRVEVGRGSGIEIDCPDPRVPSGPANTCYRVAELVLAALKARARVRIHIEKRLPVQGGLGAASSNAVATMFALERALKKRLSPAQRQRIAAEVGSDLPLFLVGGTILGVGRGEEVYPLPDFPPLPCVLVTPQIAVSTPAAFAAWDRLEDRFPAADPLAARSGRRPENAKLTPPAASDKINLSGYALSAWLAGTATGVPGRVRGRDRAEPLLLDLVRAGIANDFERVVFSEHPELGELKRLLERLGAGYSALSGSGAALYGLFARRARAERAAARLRKLGVPAVATSTLSRRAYWQRLWA
ncbi:MAG TPA: hypothetical protein VNK82_12980 [Terriglobales bacterium]|nr:hypothetical protein [Terriglobales bacterium]